MGVSLSVSGIYNNLVRVEDWNIGLVLQPISDFLRHENKPEAMWLPNPGKGKYLADPFGVIRGGRTFILCEEFEYSIGKGRIVCFEESRSHTFVRSNVAIQLPIHVSYPYLLESDGEIYCIPETSQAHEVSLYRAQMFPHTWEKASTLIPDFPGLDPTIFRFDGRLWLTCTKQDDGAWEKLFVWHANDLTGPWRPHTANPVKVNRRSSRPAGTPFLHAKSLYRPSQDCSNGYGQGIVINRVLRLTTEEFEEEEVVDIRPFQAPYLEGLHTLSSIDGLTLIDGRRLRNVTSFSEINYNIAGQWRHLLQRLGKKQM